MAKLAVMTTLASRGETVLLDDESLILMDGGYAALVSKDRHADVHAANRPCGARQSAVVVATDGV